MMNSESFIHQSFESAKRAPGAADHLAGVEVRRHQHRHVVLRNSPAAVPSPTMHHAPSLQDQQQFQQQHGHGGGGLLYNNLIPGHYRYGAKPPAPPPGPLSYQQQQQQQISIGNPPYHSHCHQQQPQHHNVQHSSSSTPRKYHQNVALSTFAASSSSSSSRATTAAKAAKVTTFDNAPPKHPGSRMGHIMKVSEPEDEEFDDIDDDLLVVKLDDDNDDDDDTNGNNNGDDEQYYRPFQHQSTTSKTTITSTGKNTSANSDHLKHSGSTHRTNSKAKSNCKNKSNNVKKVVEAEATTNSPGVDLLALLLLDENGLREGEIGGIRDNNCIGSEFQNDPHDIASLIRNASVKSQRARSLTHALAGEGQHQPTKTNKSSSASKEEKENTTNIIHNDDEKDNDRLYAAASNAHFEAALSYRRVYQTLFAMLSPTTSPTLHTLEALPTTLTSSSEVDTDRSTSWWRRSRRNWRTSSGGMTRSSDWELAKSMLMLSDMHARTAKSMYGMGLKWNMVETMTLTTTTTMQNNATTAKGALKAEEVDGGIGGISKAECGATGIDMTKANIGIVSVRQAASSSSTNNDKQRPNISNDECDDIKDKNITSSTVANAELIEILPTPPLLPPQHERLRMAVRRALDTANHEEDITNSTFLGRSTSTSTTVPKQSNQATNANNRSGNAKRYNKNKVTMIAVSGRTGVGMQPSNWSTPVDGKEGSNDCGVNPVDELMKLEKELRCMDMALEMGSSIANLGGGSGGGNAAASSFRPDGSFCVVPPGSSYASTSSMWTSGIIVGGGAGNAQTQQHHPQQKHSKQPSGAKLQNATARSRANRLQNFLGGGGINNHANLMQQPNLSPNGNPPSYQQQPPETQVNFPADNAPLDQSWWGGGQGSVMASSAILSATAIAATTSASQQTSLPTQHNPSVGSNRNSNDGDSHAVARQSSSTINARQLMQLMDSLNRLGNENAQLMREVEGAKAARAEAKAAKDMMAKFKDEYSQRFSKLKEALMKHNNNPHVNVSEGKDIVDGGNVVANSSYMKSSTMLEIQKRDQIIKQLSNDLKKERDECKRKDSALQKYEAFYREVKARSAEKARQRQQQLQKEKHQQKQMQPRP